MALRSVLDVDVNDAAFQRYQTSFKQYQDLLAKTPGAWKKVSGEIDASRKSFEELVAAAVARQGYAKLTAEAETVAKRQTESQAIAWRDMARSTRTVAGNIIDATRALLRWTALTSVFTGLLGVGGLFGIDRLAVSAAGQRRSSSGLGITPGQQSAFGLNYGRVVDTEGVLSGVNTSLTDASQRGNLYRAGLTERDIAGKDAAQVSVTLIEKLKVLADRTPTQLLGNIVTAYGLGSLGVSAQDLQRLKGRPASEIAGYRRDFERDQKGLDLTPGQQSAWEAFKVQLSRAGEQIEKTFITELTPLTGPLGELSAAFSDLVRSILGGDQGKSLIHEMAVGLHEFAGFVNSAAFKTDVKDFVTDVGKMAHATRVALGWLTGDDKTPHSDLSIGGGPPSSEPTPEEADKAAQKWWDWLKGLIPSTGMPLPGGDLITPITYRPTAGQSAAFDYVETSNNLPNGLLASVRHAESGGNDNAVSPTGAQGPFQFMPGTWARYGRGSPFNLSDASQAAGRYLGKLLSEFHGDVAKALAGYNWGEGNVEKDVARWGDDWRRHLPKETQGYLNKVIPGVGVDPRPGQRWAVNVYNHTGGNAIVTAAALPA